MEGTQSPQRPGATGTIDYQAAAERLLVNLAAHCQRKGQSRTSPISAGRLCWLVFPEQFRIWQHETRRRRIRDAAGVARQLLAQRVQAVQLVADGRGYWLTGDHAVMHWYASQRRRRGLADLRAAKQTEKPAVFDTAGQGLLFEQPRKGGLRYD